MTTRFKTSLAAGVAALSLAVATVTVIGQDQPQQRQHGPGVGGPGGPGGPGMRRPGGPMGFGPGFQMLDLSDDQKAQLKQIAESHRDEFKAASDKVRAAHEGMRALLDADAVDESAVRAKGAEIGAADAEVMLLNARVRKESMQILTPEQQAKLKELRDARPGPGGPRQRRGQAQRF